MYSLIKQIQLFKIRKKYLFKNQISYTPKSNKNYNSKILTYINSKISSKDKMLNNIGNPYNLGGKTFYIIKIMLTVFFVVLSLVKGLPIINIVIISTISFFLLDLLILLNKRNLYANIYKDLLNIVDSAYLQLASNITINKMLRDISSVCKTKVLKNAFVSMSNVYEYTGFNIQTAVLELKNRFDILEIDMFCNALVEQTLLGDNIALFENLSNVLNQKNIEQIKLNTKKKIILITIGIGVTLLNISLLVFYPIMNSFSSSFSNIFY